MTEEELKKIIGKSKIETSDDFVDKLMHTIEVHQEAKKISFWWSFRPVLIACTILALTVAFILFKFLSSDSDFLSSFAGIPKTPIFIIVALIFLYYINTIIKLNESLLGSKKKGLKN